MKKLYIIGFGVGNKDVLTVEALKIIENSTKIISTKRISSTDKNIKCCSLLEIEEEIINNENEELTILVSGDCSFFSISKLIINKFSKLYDIRLISGISSIQYLCSKIKVSYDDGIIKSLHGRFGEVVPLVSYNKKVFLLTGGKYKAQDICMELYKYGLENVNVTVGENLSYENERIITKTPSILKDEVFSHLSVMYIENKNAVNPFLGIEDKSFVRGDVPMTKEEVRWISINKLKIEQTDIIYDIGAGTGSVSIEMARKANCGFVYAIEMNEDAIKLIEENKIKHGSYNIEIVHSKAPDNMGDLPVPNKAFIGGSSGNMDEIINFLLKRNPKIKIVANAITIQSLNNIINNFKENNILYDVTCVNISKSKKAGSYDMMMAQNPVYIVCGEKNE